MFVDGLRWLAVETNERRLRSLQCNLLFPRHLSQGALFPFTPGRTESVRPGRLMHHGGLNQRRMTSQPRWRVCPGVPAVPWTEIRSSAVFNPCGVIHSNLTLNSCTSHSLYIMFDMRTNTLISVFIVCEE
jgi:hypothetical protein